MRIKKAREISKILSLFWFDFGLTLSDAVITPNIKGNIAKSVALTCN